VFSTSVSAPVSGSSALSGCVPVEEVGKREEEEKRGEDKLLPPLGGGIVYSKQKQ